MCPVTGPESRQVDVLTQDAIRLVRGTSSADLCHRLLQITVFYATGFPGSVVPSKSVNRTVRYIRKRTSVSEVSVRPWGTQSVLLLQTVLPVKVAARGPVYGQNTRCLIGQSLAIKRSASAITALAKSDFHKLARQYDVRCRVESRSPGSPMEPDRSATQQTQVERRGTLHTRTLTGPDRSVQCHTSAFEWRRSPICVHVHGHGHGRP